MNIFIARNFNDFAQCIMIRTLVFVVEQKISAELETDQFENASTHYLVKNQGDSLATARWRSVDEETAKIERVAVLKEARGNGIGTRLISCILEEIRFNSKIEMIKVGSQNSAISFYQKLGFRVIGEEYLDAGIPHHLMVKPNV